MVKELLGILGHDPGILGAFARALHWSVSPNDITNPIGEANEQMARTPLIFKVFRPKDNYVIGLQALAEKEGSLERAYKIVCRRDEHAWDLWIAYVYLKHFRR